MSSIHSEVIGYLISYPPSIWSITWNDDDSNQELYLVEGNPGENYGYTHTDILSAVKSYLESKSYTNIAISSYAETRTDITASL